MMIHSTDSKCPLLTVYHPWSQPWSAVIRYNSSNIERSLETVSRIYLSVFNNSGSLCSQIGNRSQTVAQLSRTHVVTSYKYFSRIFQLQLRRTRRKRLRNAALISVVGNKWFSLSLMTKTCIGEAVKVEVDGIVATEEEVAKGRHLEEKIIITAKMIIITIKMMMTQTKRGVPTVVDHWLKAIADMMSHTLTIGISMVINIITILKKMALWVWHGGVIA